MRNKVSPTGLGLILIFALAASPVPQVSVPDLTQRLGCWACHSLQGQGGKEASPLDRIGARLTPEALQTALIRPRRGHPGAKMPSYAQLRPWEMQALVNYLANLK